jgi:hypothetical protein
LRTRPSNTNLEAGGANLSAYRTVKLKQRTTAESQVRFHMIRKQRTRPQALCTNPPQPNTIDFLPVVPQCMVCAQGKDINAVLAPRNSSRRRLNDSSNRLPSPPLASSPLAMPHGAIGALCIDINPVGSMRDDRGDGLEDSAKTLPVAPAATIPRLVPASC